MEVRELLHEEEFIAAFPVMQQLRTHLDLPEFLRRLSVMREKGYRLFGIREGDAWVALAGIGIGTNLYYGHHLWVYDLVTSEESRSKGYGARLLEFVENLAREKGCKLVALSSGVQRVDAHRFYEDKMGYDRVSYVFKKDL